MKRLFFLLLILSQNILYSKHLNESKDSGGTKLEEKPFKSYYKSGELEVEYYFKNGEIDGLYKIYFKNGKLKSETNYKNSKTDGLFKSYYKSGELKLESNYENDVKSGLFKSYFKNGKLETEHNYKNGKIDGLSKSYYKSGELNGTFKYKKNKMSDVVIYKKSGKLISKAKYKNGKKDGLLRQYYENEKLSLEAFYKNGKLNGLEKKYHQNGKIKLSTFYINGEQGSKVITCKDNCSNITANDGGWFSRSSREVCFDYCKDAKEKGWFSFKDPIVQTKWQYIEHITIDNNILSIVIKNNGVYDYIKPKIKIKFYNDATKEVIGEINIGSDKIKKFDQLLIAKEINKKLNKTVFYSISGQFEEFYKPYPQITCKQVGDNETINLNKSLGFNLDNNETINFYHPLISSIIRKDQILKFHLKNKSIFPLRPKFNISFYDSDFQEIENDTISWTFDRLQTFGTYEEKVNWPNKAVCVSN